MACLLQSGIFVFLYFCNAIDILEFLFLHVDLQFFLPRIYLHTCDDATFICWIDRVIRNFWCNSCL